MGGKIMKTLLLILSIFACVPGAALCFDDELFVSSTAKKYVEWFAEGTGNVKMSPEEEQNFMIVTSFLAGSIASYGSGLLLDFPEGSNYHSLSKVVAKFMNENPDMLYFQLDELILVEVSEQYSGPLYPVWLKLLTEGSEE
jgi:hypothetical protein